MVGEIVVKHISHLNEFVVQLYQLNMKEAQFIKDFDSRDSFSTHMSLVEYSSYFNKSEQFKEGGGDNQNLPKASI